MGKPGRPSGLDRVTKKERGAVPGLANRRDGELNGIVERLGAQELEGLQRSANLMLSQRKISPDGHSFLSALIGARLRILHSTGEPELLSDAPVATPSEAPEPRFFFAKNEQGPTAPPAASGSAAPMASFVKSVPVAPVAPVSLTPRAPISPPRRPVDMGAGCRRTTEGR